MKKFNNRALISLITMFLGLMVLISGLVLLIMPDASLAYWNNWSLLGLNKNDWESFHGVISIYFTVIIVFHIIQNIKAMLSYMKAKAGQEFKNKKELIIASSLSVFIIFTSAIDSPISAITNVFEPVQEAWYDKKDEPPFEDAQALPLKLLFKLELFKQKEVEEIFTIYKIKYENFNESLEEIAENNDISSKRLYILLKKNLNN